MAHTFQRLSRNITFNRRGTGYHAEKDNNTNDNNNMDFTMNLQ